VHDSAPFRAATVRERTLSADGGAYFHTVISRKRHYISVRDDAPRIPGGMGKLVCPCHAS